MNPNRVLVAIAVVLLVGGGLGIGLAVAGGSQTSSGGIGVVWDDSRIELLVLHVDDRAIGQQLHDGRIGWFDGGHSELWMDDGRHEGSGLDEWWVAPERDDGIEQ